MHVHGMVRHERFAGVGELVLVRRHASPAIVAALRAAGLPSAISNTAGNFVCNHVFYGACHLRATRFKTMRVGFIHTPYSLEQGARHPGAPTMAVETIAAGLRVAVEATLADSKEARKGRAGSRSDAASS